MKIDIFSFYRSHYPRLWRDSIVKHQVLAYNSSPVKVYHSSNKRKMFNQIMDHYVEDANYIISLIKMVGMTKRKKYLEIGGGLGLVYGYLKYLGFNIYSLEPSISGYGGFWPAAKNLLTIASIDTTNWLPYKADEAENLGVHFDVIFSNNVLEHISNLRASLLNLSRVLNVNGIMIHNTVNYWVPYEPHYKIPLVPLFPKLTELINPDLKRSPVWSDLNFINPLKLYFIAWQCGLDLKIIPGQLLKTIKRLSFDKEFARRHHKINKYLLLLKLMTKLPAILQTPLVFTLSHSSAINRSNKT